MRLSPPAGDHGVKGEGEADQGTDHIDAHIAERCQRDTLIGGTACRTQYGRDQHQDGQVLVAPAGDQYGHGLLHSRRAVRHSRAGGTRSRIIDSRARYALTIKAGAPWPRSAASAPHGWAEWRKKSVDEERFAAGRIVALSVTVTVGGL